LAIQFVRLCLQGRIPGLYKVTQRIGEVGGAGVSPLLIGLHSVHVALTSALEWLCAVGVAKLGPARLRGL
jgi:hypothetical protein